MDGETAQVKRRPSFATSYAKATAVKKATADRQEITQTAGGVAAPLRLRQLRKSALWKPTR